MKREAAWRVFAGELNDSTFEIKGEGEKTPSYVVTPLGAKVNRLFIIGVLTDVESISEGGDLVRAHVSDPTGVFTLYSGSYQQDVTNTLTSIEVPAFVAIVGKVRTFSPEEGVLYVSVRPENVMEVTADIRDKWILETCRNTKDRIEAMFEAMKMNDPNVYDLCKLGFSKNLSEGVVLALKNYGKVDLNKYVALIQESLQFLLPDKESLPVVDEKKKTLEKEEKVKEEAEEISTEEEPVLVDEKEETEAEDVDEDSLEVENTVLGIIKDIEGEEGASWDEIMENCKKAGLEKDLAEEALTSLMDKGLVYEPVLGTIKTT